MADENFDWRAACIDAERRYTEMWRERDNWKQKAMRLYHITRLIRDVDDGLVEFEHFLKDMNIQNGDINPLKSQDVNDVYEELRSMCVGHTHSAYSHCIYAKAADTIEYLLG